MYRLYIAAPFDNLFTYYDASNHVLQTLLSRISVKLFGLSEFTLRLPSLLGGLLYLMAGWRLCRFVLKNDCVFLLGVAVLSLNPFITDYLSIARGYGMALGFFVAALYLIVRSVGEESACFSRRSVSLGTLLLGLSVAANLAFAVPTVALGALLTLIVALDRRAGSVVTRLLQSIRKVWLPFMLPVVILVVPPLSHARKDAFYYGEKSLKVTSFSLVSRSFFHQYNIWRPESVPLKVGRATDFLADWVAPIWLFAVAAVLLAVCIRWLRARDYCQLHRLDRVYLLVAADIVLSLAAFILAHRLVGVLYPSDRTAIYLAALATLASIILIERLVSAPSWFMRLIGLASTAGALVALFYFIRGFPTSYYYEWPYSVDTRQVIERIIQEHEKVHKKHIKVGVDWKLADGFNFYRDMYHLGSWLEPFTRDKPPESGGFDYYVLLPEDVAAHQTLSLRTIYQDRISKQDLALPAESSAPSN